MTTKPAHRRGDLEQFAFDLLVRGVISAITKTTLAPFSTVNLVHHVQKLPSNVQGEKWGYFETFRNIFARHGFFSFWRGAHIGILHSVSTQMISSKISASLRSIFITQGQSSPIRISNTIAIGGVSNAIALLFTFPLDIVYLRLATDVGKIREFEGTLDCITTIYKKDGLFGLYAGYGATIIANIVFLGTRLVLYSIFKPAPSDPLWKQVVVVQLIGVTAGFLAFPFTAVRREMMMQAGKDKKKYRNSWDCLTKILQQPGGMKAIFDGALFYSLQTLIASSILIGYDIGKPHVLTWIKDKSKKKK